MGVKIGEILKHKFFAPYTVVAGRKGLDRQTQAVALFDAPDGYKWFKGKELVLSSGYLFQDQPDLLLTVITFLHQKNSTALAIKTDRYLKEIPQEAIDLCETLAFPLIHVPYDVAWIDIINAVNSIAMNQYIIHINQKKNTDAHLVRSDNFYQKIEKTLKILSEEIECPVSVADILEKKTFTYPQTYPVLEKHISYSRTDEFNFNYQKKLLGDKLSTYRIENLEDPVACPFIVMPLSIKGTAVAKLIVWEVKEEIDYYDLFSVRLTYTLLLDIYEQIYLMNSFERRFYDDLIKSLVQGELQTRQALIQATLAIEDFKLHIDHPFVCIAIKQAPSDPSFYNSRESISNHLLLSLPRDKSIFGIWRDDTILILYDVRDQERKTAEYGKELLRPVFEDIQTAFPNRQIKIGIGTFVKDICSVRDSYIEALKAAEIGVYLYPQEDLVAFEDLGPFGLLRVESIQKKGFKSHLGKLSVLLEESNAQELLQTLKAYLENESNSNLTAGKLYIHSNTVRYRIHKIQQVCQVDLTDPIERLKIEVALQFFDPQLL